MNSNSKEVAYRRGSLAETDVKALVNKIREQTLRGKRTVTPDLYQHSNKGEYESDFSSTQSGG